MNRKILILTEGLSNPNSAKTACSVIRYRRDEVVGVMDTTVPPQPAQALLEVGKAQGIGQAMLESCVYDENGQLVSASYMDYAMPRANDLPNFTVDHSCQTPCTHNPLGVKGCGEAGAIGSPPALVNAVVDALQRNGKDVTHIDMPLSPARVWAAMNG